MTETDRNDHPYDPGAAVTPTTPSDPEAGRGQLITVLVLFGINLYLLIGVVPKFKTMFDALKGELPYLTQLTLELSNFLSNNVLIILGILLLPVWFAMRNPARVPLALNIVLMVVLAGGIVATPLAIFYPILQLQAAVRGDQPSSGQPSDGSRSP